MTYVAAAFWFASIFHFPLGGMSLMGPKGRSAVETCLVSELLPACCGS